MAGGMTPFRATYPGGGGGAGVYATLTATAAQDLPPGAETPITYSTSDTSAGITWNGSERLTVTNAGVYLMVYAYSYGDSATNGNRITVFRHNNVTFLSVRHPLTAAHKTGTLSAVVSLAAHDYVHVNQYQSTANTTQTSNQPYPKLSLVRQ